ncbi:hypothetical protein NEM56_25930, partial [Escherichia coli]|nr:hypothetical protein [Escherichia coli]
GVSDEQKTIKIDTRKIKHIEYQFITVVVMTNEISKTSLFPRVHRPVVRVPIQEDPRRSGRFINVMRYTGLTAYVIRMYIPGSNSQNCASDVVLWLSPCHESSQ